ncbi:MAG: zinc ribbon domain-containing protein [Oscillospiraceae bacterium]|nr:zinc ribbon domain-containing protein [Oscillospiraceae bacterium]
MESKLKFCPKCGQQLVDEVTFCTNCGENLSIYAQASQAQPQQQAQVPQNVDPAAPAPVYPSPPNTQTLDKKLVAKALIIGSCVLIALLFFTKWYTNDADVRGYPKSYREYAEGSFSPFDRAMQVIQGKFVISYDREEFVDTGFLIYDITVSTFFVISLILLFMVIYRASKNEDCRYIYRVALNITISTCAVALIGAFFLNGERKSGYWFFESEITMATTFYFTALIAIASRIFVCNYLASNNPGLTAADNAARDRCTRCEKAYDSALTSCPHCGCRERSQEFFG